MVYLGFGILAASLSVLIYRHGFSSWSRLLEFWNRPNSVARGSRGSSQISRSGAEKADRVSDEGHIQEQVKPDSEGKHLKSSQLTSDSRGVTIQTSVLLPSFTVDDGMSNDDKPTERLGEPPDNNLGVIQRPVSLAPSRAQAREITSTAMPPPPRPSQTSKRKLPAPTSSLMPPPSQASPTVPSLRPLPGASSTRQPPPSAASNLRAPTSRSLARSSSSLAPSTSTLAPANRPSKKVLLDPGHSPLDWAYLTKNPPTPTHLRGAAVPPDLIRVSPSLLRYHNGRKGKDAWGVWQGKVYNLTPYLKFHPGGVDELMKAAGREKDGQRLFLEVHPWVSWESMLGECLVGILVGEDDVKLGHGDSGNPLDEMD